jgi:hypothetical protein
VACKYCTDPGTGKTVYPYYGLAPHTHPGTYTIDNTIYKPRSEWPENFKPDEDSPRCGVYEYCLECGDSD